MLQLCFKGGDLMILNLSVSAQQLKSLLKNDCCGIKSDKHKIKKFVTALVFYLEFSVFHF